MYFVDRKKIERMLACLEATTAVFRDTKDYHTPLAQYGLERMGHLMIDSILDVGNAMIDGFIMRDPGSYEDIIDILMDEKVVDGAEGEQLKEIVRLRKVLVQDYMEIEHDAILATLQQHLIAVEAYPTRIRRYLEQELGPVSAFSNS